MTTNFSQFAGLIELKLFSELASQARQLRWLIALLLLAPLLVLSTTMVASVETGVPIGSLLSDPTATLQISPFTGLISNLGVLLWCVAASICLFTGFVLKGKEGSQQFAVFVICSGLITVLLLLDDLFLFHEKLFPTYLGVNENVTFSSYIVLIAGWLWLFRKQVHASEYLVLFMAFGFFVLSLFVDTYDQIDSLITSWRELYEDGFKFLGIVSWCGYFCRTCSVEIRRASLQQEAFEVQQQRPEDRLESKNRTSAVS